MTATTWDSGAKDADITLTGGDLTATQTGGSTGNVRSTFSASTGRYYFEFTHGGNNFQAIGVTTGTHDLDLQVGGDSGAGDEGVGYRDNDGNVRIDGATASAYGDSWTSADVISVAIDLTSTTRAVWFAKNGVWQNSATEAEIEAFDSTNAADTWTATRTMYAAWSGVDSGADPTGTINFGTTAFTYNPPRGFHAFDDEKHYDGKVNLSLNPIDVRPGLSGGAPQLSLNPTNVRTGLSGANVNLSLNPTNVRTGLSGGNVQLSLNPTGVSTGINASINLTLNPTDQLVSFSAPITGAMTLPSFTLAGVLMRGATALGAVTLPALSTTGAVLPGQALSGAFNLPTITVAGGFGAAGSIQLPIPQLSAQLKAGTVSVASLTLPKYSVSGGFLSAPKGAAALTLPALVVGGTLLAGSAYQATINLPSFTLSNLLVGGSAASAALSLPKLTATGTYIFSNFATAALTLPVFEVTGTEDNAVTLTFTGWVVNTENLAHTNYSNFAFHSFGELGGVDLAAKSDGIYTLGGNLDQASNIAASFQTGIDDLGQEELKKALYAYLGYKSDGNMVLRLDVDGQEATLEYDVDRVMQGVGSKPARIVLGKGIRSRYFQLGMANLAGADFDIEELGLLIPPTKRKT